MNYRPIKHDINKSSFQFDSTRPLTCNFHSNLFYFSNFYLKLIFMLVLFRYLFKFYNIKIKFQVTCKIFNRNILIFEVLLASLI